MSDLSTERRRTLDLDRPLERLLLVRDLSAMANSGGGTIIIGVSSDGQPVGLGAELAEKLDTGSVSSAVSPYTEPDELVLRVDRHLIDGGYVVEIHVGPADEPPIVLGVEGVVPVGGHHVNGTDERNRLVFEEHSVWVRRGGRSRPARREDHRRWRDDATATVRRTILEQLSLVLTAPAGARVQVITDDDVLEQPNFLLRRSADLFSQRPDRLLSADDLLYLWLSRASLDLSVPDARALLIQSALRRRATLFLWLAQLDLPLEEVHRQLRRALGMNDRDKSDAARSILQVAALHLGDGDYARLRNALAGSGYTHMRSAAADWPEPHDARASLAPLANARYQRLTAGELESEAELTARRRPSRAVRVLPAIGLALLNRRLALRERPAPISDATAARPDRARSGHDDA